MMMDVVIYSSSKNSLQNFIHNLSFEVYLVIGKARRVRALLE